jgi:hypothetical protein
MALYETLDDRRRQWAICDDYAYTFGLEFEMTPDERHLPWDAEFTRAGRLVSIAEVKTRTCRRLKYQTYKIDKRKVDGMLAMAVQCEVRCGVLVEFTDGRFKVPISAAWLAANARVSVIERKNRAGETPDPAWEWSNHLWTPLADALP